MKTQELKLRVRKESLRKKIRQAGTETQDPELVEEFEAKRDLRECRLSQFLARTNIVFWRV